MADKSAVVDIVARQDWSAIRDALESWAVPDIAELLRDLDPSSRAVVFRLIPRERASRVFAYLDGHARDVLLTSLTDEETRAIIERMDPDDRTRLLAELPGTAVQRLLNLLRGDQLELARRLLGYPPESAGRLMTPEYVAIRDTWTATRALAHVRRIGKRIENVTAVFAVDDSWRLKGILSLQELVLADDQAEVGTLLTGPVITLHPEDDREVAVDLMLHHDLIILPVVDQDGVLLGIVTADDIFDVAEEEATEDFQLSGAVMPLHGSYRDATVLALCRNRLPWLGSLVFVNLAASGVIAAYEETLASMLALTFFLPLLLGAAGNAGAQASTLTVRALATGDLEPSEWRRAAVKEVAVGLALGTAMAALAWILASWRADTAVALVVALSMATVILVANIVGLTLPFVLSRLNVDPAVASNPLITSISDVTGVAIYLSIAASALAETAR